MKVIIDRFEGEFAVVEMENKVMVNLPRILIPKGKEGDVVNISINENETEKRKLEIEKLAKKLWID